MVKYLNLARFFILSWLLLPLAALSFPLEKITFEGLERIGQETTLTYFPFELGDNFGAKEQQEALHELYKTGFFNDIAFYQGEAGELIIKLEERPSIAELTLQGNKLIKTDDMKVGLEGLGIKEGKIYNSLDMNRVIQDLQSQYHNQGYYAAAVAVDVTQLTRNRVNLVIRVEEGRPASIERIELAGNSSFSDERIKKLFGLRESVIFGRGDTYSKPEIESDFETLRTFYMDRGFAEFDINSSQVSLSPDKTQVFINTSITEGPQYRLGEIKFSGSSKLTHEEFNELAKLEKDELFSRTKIINAVNKIQDHLSEEGYAFAEIDPRTELDRETKTADLNFYIDPKSRVYVREIQIQGNTRTRDYVVRREVRQLEKAPYSLAAVRRTTDRLNRLGYFSKVDMDTRRVSEDEVDLIIQVEEQPTGSFTAGIGYSQLDGVSFNVGISEKNFLGTGNELEFSVQTSASTKSTDIGITNPYFTDDGVSLSAGIFMHKVDAYELNIADYNIDKMGFRTGIGYPTSENTRLNFGIRGVSQELNCVSAFETCHDHLVEYGADDQHLMLTASWRYDTRNHFYFPSKGHLTRVSLQSVIPGTSDITFYKAFLEERVFVPLSENFSFKLSGDLAYGEGFGDNSNLPFYERFYAGGIGSVRGFESNTLGGYYGDTEINRPRGGNLRSLASAEVVFPMPLIEDSSNIRLSLFVDAGAVFLDSAGESFDLGKFSSSYGLGFSWITPVGPLAFSFARPLKSQPKDREQFFQFNLGVPF